MFGDFSRDSFDACKNYTRVLMQQGRPLTDADWNEQVSILLYQVRALAAAFAGWHGTGDRGFALEGQNILAGRYYVDGMLAENECTFKIGAIPANSIVYLDVWDDSVNAVAETDLLEPALGGIDTSARATTRWALRTLALPENGEARIEVIRSTSRNRKEFLRTISGRDKAPLLKVLAESSRRESNGPCEAGGTPTDQSDCLYRVEIHRAGIAAAHGVTGAVINAETPTIATFKWSRLNGAAVAEVAAPTSDSLKLIRSRGDFAKDLSNSWIELMDFEGRSINESGRLLQVKSIHGDQISLTGSAKTDLQTDAVAASYSLESSAGYFIRKWDHKGTALRNTDAVSAREASPQPDYRILASDGCLAVIAGKPIDLEGSIQVEFNTDKPFRSGDYWLIRVTSTGIASILPGHKSASGCARNEHHYAPLYLMGDQALTESFRSEFPQEGRPWPPANRIMLSPYTCDSTTVPRAPVEADALGPANTPRTPPPECCAAPASPAIQFVSLLSKDGSREFKRYLDSPKDLTRRVPARYLNHEPETKSYSRFRSALLVSEILEESFDKYFAKVQRCLTLDDGERAAVEQDARADYALAREFERMLLAGDKSRAPIA